MAYLYTAAQCPIPVDPASPPVQADCTDTTTTAPSYAPDVSGMPWNPLTYNQGVAQTAAAFAYAGGGYGLIEGCTLTVPGSGLGLPVSAGVISCMGAVPINANTVVVPDNTGLIFIWALQNGTLTYTTSTTKPTSNCVYIGNTATVSGNITTVDYSAVPYVIGGTLVLYTNDVGAPTSSPHASTTFLTLTKAGAYQWNGTAHTPVGPTAVTQTPSSTVTLTALDSPNQTITPTANVVVLLPGGPTSTMSFVIKNGATIAEGYTVTVKDSTATNTIAVIQPGWMANIPVLVGGASSTPYYPSSVTPTTGNTANSIYASAQGSVTGGTSISFALVSPGGAVAVAVLQPASPAVAISSVTYNGLTMTNESGGTQLGFGTVSIWLLLNAPVGSFNVVVTLGTSSNAIALASSILGPHTMSLGATANGNSGSATSASLSPSANVGDLVFDAIIANQTLTTTTNLIQSGTTGGDSADSSYAQGVGGATTIGYTLGSSGSYAYAAMVIVA